MESMGLHPFVWSPHPGRGEVRVGVRGGLNCPRQTSGGVTHFGMSHMGANVRVRLHGPTNYVDTSVQDRFLVSRCRHYQFPSPLDFG